MPRVRPKSSNGTLQREKRGLKSPMVVQKVAKRKRRDSWMLRKFFFILCFMGFVGNSYNNMEKYWTGGKTVTESWVWSKSKKLQLPALTICPAATIYSHFLSKDYGKPQLEDLLDCTMFQGKDCLQCMNEARDNMKIKKVNFSDHKVIYTGYRGKCFTVKPPYEVTHSPLNRPYYKTSAMGFLGLKLGSEPSLIYLHEPDEQFFIHMAWYPGKPPPVIEAGSDINFKLAIITRSKFESDDNCKQWSTHDQIECLKQNIRADYEKSKLNCTLLWLNSMLDPIPPINELCQTEQQSNDLFNLVHNRMALHMSITCPASCSQVHYDLSLESFGALSPNRSRFIFVSYGISATRLVQSVPLCSLHDFISNVGGNMGLFLNFSIISMLMALLKWIQGK